MYRTRTFLFAMMAVVVCLQAERADAQITQSRIISAEPDRLATLDEQLTNRLRATTREQQAYIDFVVHQVKLNKLDVRLVVAIERYAIRRNRQLPFLYFERALRVEAAKRGIALPSVRQFASTRIRIE